MAKVQAAARFMTEVAPPQFVSIMRPRKVPRSLDTIAEDDREAQAAYSEHYYYGKAKHAASKSSASGGSVFTPASPPAGGGFMRELSKCFSNNVVHGQSAAAGGGWENRHKGLRRVVDYAPRLHKNTSS